MKHRGFGYEGGVFMPYAIVGGLALIMLAVALFYYSLIKKLIYDSVKQALLDAHSEIQSRITFAAETANEPKTTTGESENNNK
jgi:hypothetical protein